MQLHQRTFLIVLIALLVLSGVGLLITSDLGNRVINGPNRLEGPQSEVDLAPIHTAQALVPLASGPDEQGLARDALRLADHEIDIAFTSALEEAAEELLANRRARGSPFITLDSASTASRCLASSFSGTSITKR